jgi:glyceraldehyde 3-phosphate dehydrogenase
MPCTNVFDRQSADYKAAVLRRLQDAHRHRSGASDFWRKYVGLHGAVIGIDRFGESAPAGQLFKYFGFTVANVVSTASGDFCPDSNSTRGESHGYQGCNRQWFRSYRSLHAARHLRAGPAERIRSRRHQRLRRSGDQRPPAQVRHHPRPLRTSVETEGENCIIIDGKKIAFYSTKDPKGVNWASHGVDVLLECTGAYTTKAKAQALLDQGAKRVLISAPGGDDVDTTIVMGVNEGALKAGMTVVSNASCTTNCLAPVAKILSDSVGIKQGLMTTIHAYTNDQVTVDVRHKDLRRARAAAANIIPTKTGAAKAVGLVLPQLVGKVDGFALRVPTINVSLVDLTFTADRATTKEEINALMTAAANGPLKGILDVNNEPLVSSDFNHTTVSSTFDATQTRVIKGEDGSVLVKVLAWYDNEWGYSCRMLDAARAWMNAK